VNNVIDYNKISEEEFKIGRELENFKYAHVLSEDGTETRYMKRHNTLIVTTRTPSGAFVCRLLTIASGDSSYLLIDDIMYDRPRDRDSMEMMIALGWVNPND
jgi:hypothetical protein